MKVRILSVACGLLFAAGLTLSGMTLPAKVTGFLDIAGNWDPSLALVMGGALGVLFVARLFGPQRPLWVVELEPAPPRQVDTALVTGAALFGIGWGLSGFCPGPAVVSASGGTLSALLFFPAMVAGMLLEHVLLRRRRRRAADAVACG
jgi:uncharacterized membrane protein YedE/YeeE